MDPTQQGVARGMALAMLTAIVVYVVAAIYVSRVWGVGTDLAARATVAAWSLVLPALTLLACIARLAKHRFFTPADINGSALTNGTERARLLQTLLQNTLEQTCLAAPVYIAAAIIVPGFLLPLVPAAALMFVIGRVAFFAGYANGAPARAFGFALTFYPTALLLAVLLVLGALRLTE